jgi:hypothetical protein
VRPIPSRAALLVAAALTLCGAAAPSSAQSKSISILVLKEHGVGSPTLAQPYVDRFIALAAEDNGWSDAKGHYLLNRGAAETFIQKESPHYGILSLPAFLALRGPYRMEVLGRVASSLAGGEQYFVVSKTAPDLAGCKGKTFASDHFSDARFVEKVVVRGDFKLSEFNLMKNQRPFQSLRQVLSGAAVCAFLDDAQLAELRHLQGGDQVKVVWQSRKLPPMAVVAFPTAGASERKTFRANLKSVCEGSGTTACAEVGIHALEPASASDYAEVVAAYGR